MSVAAMCVLSVPCQSDALCLQGVQHQLVQGLKEAWQSMRPQVGSLCQPVLGMCQQGRPSKIDQRPQTEAICSVGGHPGQLLQDDSISDDGTDSMWPHNDGGGAPLDNP